MAIPDRIRNIHVMTPTVSIPAAAPVRNTNSQENSSTTAVRIAVARVESVFLMPIFAKIAVIPANKAEPQARPSHMTIKSFHYHKRRKKGGGFSIRPLSMLNDTFSQTNMMDTGLSS